jgi:hypothetical protein
MTGPEHYKEAEEILARAKADLGDDRPLITLAVAVAQVHATLALAAATAFGLTDGERDRGMPNWECVEWERVAGVKPT